jgi:feruloyl esterase
MGHCGGGEGFSHIGGATGTPLQNDANHDMVRALERWVTAKEAPSAFIAAHVSDDKKVTATRPICRYPLEARYSGHGNMLEAANFSCRPPL